MPITSESIIFGNELIRFSDIGIADGIIFFYLIINGEKYTDENETESNKLILNKIGIKLRPVEMKIFISNNVLINITLRILNKEQDEFYEERKISQKIKIEDFPMSFKDRIKLFSGGKSFQNTYKDLLRKSSIKVSSRPSLVSNKI